MMNERENQLIIEQQSTLIVNFIERTTALSASGLIGGQQIQS
jgi:hypothetical protein